jgi:putative Ca2+/H+ antiporter (TMEM165/GDT1 family)
MEALLVSTGLVALAEIGDKTQLLSLVLAARYRKPLPIVLGIFASTVLNHAFAAGFGAWISNLVGPEWMARAVGISFLVMAAWILVPDKLDDGEEATRTKHPHGVFLTTCILFFLAEMGDKTQVATVVLGARYDSLVQVVLGTTLGMLLANVPVVYFGDAISRRVPVSIVRRVAAAAFALLGLLALFWR